MKSVKQEILDYAKKTYKSIPDNPFSLAPTYQVLRHEDTRKWFALFMDITRDKLGLDGTDVIDVINLKCNPILSGSLRKMKGYFPAYHMHRENWITILLDGTVPTKYIIPLIDLSFELTDKKPRKTKK